MLECENTFENLISKFKIVFGKLQIDGYHGAHLDPRRNKSVSPCRFTQSQHKQSKPSLQKLFEQQN